MKKPYKKPVMVKIFIFHESCIAATSLSRVVIDNPTDPWQIESWTIDPNSPLPQPNQNEISL